VSLRILALEPYYGGSHRSVLDGVLAGLGWEHDLLTLPARKWKWRMSGAALTFADAARALGRAHLAPGSIAAARGRPARRWS
jgi:hypothetical protein